MKKTNNLVIRISDELKEEVKKTANKLNISVAALVTIAIIEKLNRIQGE